MTKQNLSADTWTPMLSVCECSHDQDDCMIGVGHVTMKMLCENKRMFVKLYRAEERHLWHLDFSMREYQDSLSTYNSFLQ